MQPKWVRTAIDRGLSFIASTQAADGSFASFSSPVRAPFRPALTYQTTFTPALILSAIGGHRSNATDKLAAWLLAQKSPHWSFNYWAASAPQRQTLPYPDDLDDTFCALFALRQYDPSLIGGEALASVVKLLIATEAETGGPYRTWLTDADAPKVWRDVDLAVNANIAVFLRLAAGPLPKLTRLMEQAITTRTFRSPYYPSAYPVVYYIARAYDGPLASDLARYLISKRRNGWWGSPLPTALAVTSLVRLGHADACAEALERLAAAQQPDGSWQAEAFCLDPAIQNKAYYSGAPALTTAFAVEALSAFRPASRTRTQPHKQSNTEGEIRRQITTLIQRDLKTLGPALRPQVQTLLRRTLSGDADGEIALLAHFFNQSLQKPLPAHPELFAHLGTANLYGWTAYTIYDDFLDNEGDPQMLSAANMAMRYSVEHFRQALPNDTAFQKYTVQVFNAVDNANAWELANCRAKVASDVITITSLPRYTRTLDLADRSLGHTLAPLAILAATGIAPDDPRAKRASLALRHYIAARQLNDDMHDWQQDLRAGIITYVVTQLLHGTAVQPGTHKLSRLMPDLQRHFWHTALPSLCQTAARHAALAYSSTRASGLFKPDNLITQLSGRITNVIRKTLQEQASAKEFLTAYSAPAGTRKTVSTAQK